MLGSGPLGSRPLASASGSIKTQTTVSITDTQVASLSRQPLRNVITNVYTTYIIAKIPARFFTVVNSTITFINKQSAKTMFVVGSNQPLVSITKNSIKTISNSVNSVVVRLKSNNKVVNAVQATTPSTSTQTARGRYVSFVANSIAVRNNVILKTNQIIQNNSLFVSKIGLKTFVIGQTTVTTLSHLLASFRNITYTSSQTSQLAKTDSKRIVANSTTTPNISRFVNYYRMFSNIQANIVSVFKTNNKSFNVVQQTAYVVKSQAFRIRQLITTATSIVSKNIVVSKTQQVGSTVILNIRKQGNKITNLVSTSTTAIAKGLLYVRSLTYNQLQQSTIQNTTHKNVVSNVTTTQITTRATNYYRTVAYNSYLLVNSIKALARQISQTQATTAIVSNNKLLIYVLKFNQFVQSYIINNSLKNITSQQSSLSSLFKLHYKFIGINYSPVVNIIRGFVQNTSSVVESSVSNISRIPTKSIAITNRSASMLNNLVYKQVQIQQQNVIVAAKQANKLLNAIQQQIVNVYHQISYGRFIIAISNTTSFVRNITAKTVNTNQASLISKTIANQKNITSQQQTIAGFNKTNFVSKIISQSTTVYTSTVANIQRILTDVVQSVVSTSTIGSYIRQIAVNQYSTSTSVVGRYYIRVVNTTQSTFGTIGQSIKKFVTECCRIIGINLLDTTIDVPQLNNIITVADQTNALMIASETNTITIDSEQNTINIPAQINVIDVAACNCTETK